MTKTKRRRPPKAKPGELIITYGSFHGEDPDMCASWGGSGASKSDGGMVLYYLNPPEWMHKDENLAKELEARGYDLNTLRFSIKRKVQDQPQGERK